MGIVQTKLSDAETQFSTFARSQGFRLDGHPCIAGATDTTCGIWGERMSGGVEELFVATLNDDGRGNTTGTLAVSEAAATQKK